MNQAVQFLDQTFTNAITVTIEVGWGEIGGQALPAGELGEGGPDNGATYTYNQVTSALASHITSAADATAVASLPITDPTHGGPVYIGGAEAKALGLMDPNAAGIDGEVGFQGNVDEGVILHELTHTMGRIAYLGEASSLGDFSILDLFRYTAPGVLDPTALSGAYLSADGGRSVINYFDSTSCLGSWNGSTTDAFNAYLDPSSTISAADIETMNLLGFTSAGAVAPAATSQTSAPASAHDFNGDKSADVEMQNDSTGQVWIWDMRGTSIVGGGSVATPDPGWRVKTVGDVNADGKADIVLQQAQSGQVWVWQMNGNAIVGGGNVATPDAGWEVAASGDVNGDGRADIILQNATSGQAWVWEMQGNAIVGGGNIARPDPGWLIKATGDTNGNGTADVILQNTGNGQVWVWQMSGNGIVGGGSVGTPDPGWQVVTTADFNGDGKADILLQNGNTGEVGLWEMNGNTAFRFDEIGVPDPGWQVKTAADFTGDGHPDILLQQAQTGQVWLWAMSGATITGGGNVATPNPGWHIPVG